MLKENLDAEKWLLGTPGGIYDLKNGCSIKEAMSSPVKFDVMRHPFGTENIVTRQTAVTPAGVTAVWRVTMFSVPNGCRITSNFTGELIASLIEHPFLRS